MLKILLVVSTLVILLFFAYRTTETYRNNILETANTHDYIKKYNKLPNASDETKVIISFSLHDDNDFKPFLNSILDQSKRVDEIIAIVPSENTIIPDYAKQVVIPLVSKKSCGFGSKIIHTLLYERDADTIIIGLDSKNIYPYDYVETITDKLIQDKTLTLFRDDTIALRPCGISEDIIDRNLSDYPLSLFKEKCHNIKKLWL